MKGVHDGSTEHPLYQVWKGMLKRCMNPKATGYKNYGGRGIKVCLDWQKDFWAFVSSVGARPSLDHTLDRFPNKDGDYEPGNVRWATQKEQNSNTNYNRPLTAKGETKTLTEWSEGTGLPKSTIHNRLDRGWSEEDAVTTQARGKSPSNSVTPPSLNEDCKKLGVDPRSVSSRVRRGWNYQQALTTPFAKAKGGNYKKD